ncbi:hypothetical protein HGRIS_005846 [Hohenbuehelia grisea]|uniref:Rho-GAP domain-containing protein n=1 Tax=Hohenbuehelia grisea TaxID=104357 RepID=A0ABR3K0D4_9AGAR
MPPGGLSLKQRLTALSLSPSSPTGPSGSASSPSKRRFFFNTTRIGRGHNGDSPGTAFEDPNGQHAVDQVVNRLIFQAGVDFETRPMVIMNASALPDPKEVSYDLLLSRVLSYLDLYVESDYTVVFFAAGSRHTPGWNWVWKAYRSLSRKYLLFSLAGAIISPKFFRKLEYIPTLSQLACHIPLTQIDIPPAVYQENLKHESEITLPVPTRSNIFGVPLEELMGYDGEKGGIPRVVKECIQFLRENGLQEEGLFRRSPHSALLRSVKDAYDRGQVMSLQTFGDPHIAAVLLKKYLRDLPEPIFPESLYPAIRKCPLPTVDDEQYAIRYLRETLLPQLVPCAYILLSNILQLLHDVTLRSSTNLMDARNLAIVICPNLVKGKNPILDIGMCAVPGAPSMSSSFPTNAAPTASAEGRTTLGAVLLLCIQRYYEVFDEVLDRSEAISPARVLGAASSAPSSSGENSPRAQNGEDEEIDDTMLVMPIGPNGAQRTTVASAAPSAWASNVAANHVTRHRSKPSWGSGSGVRSMHTLGDGIGGGHPSGTIGRAKSLISVESGTSAMGRKGSIAVGRGTTRKTSGAAVEAISITAEGFFTPPSNAPPLPRRP